MPISSNAIGPELLRALGLDPKGIYGVTVSFQANDPVEVQVRLLPAREQAEEVIEIVKRYELHEKED